MALPKRHYDTARVRAELAGKTSYAGSPCTVNREHVSDNGTTVRDTTRYRCLLCHKNQRQTQNVRRRERYTKETSK